MSEMYHCPECGRELRYQGLCWQCKAERERREMLAWSPEQVREKLEGLTQHVERLEENAWDKDFWALLSYHNAITPEFQRAALAAELYYPSEIYYRAPADVRDGLVHALLETENSREANRLMCCLAMQGDDRALEVFRELEEHPRPWREKLYVDPSVYAHTGGWTFDKAGNRRQLNFDTCYPLIKGDRSRDKAAQVFRPREDRCPHCKGRVVDILTLDGRDARRRTTATGAWRSMPTTPMSWGWSLSPCSMGRSLTTPVPWAGFPSGFRTSSITPAPTAAGP